MHNFSIAAWDKTHGGQLDSLWGGGGRIHGLSCRGIGVKGVRVGVKEVGVKGVEKRIKKSKVYIVDG